MMFYIRDLLEKDTSDLHQILKSDSTQKVLDIGCGFPIQLFQLYHKLNISNFEAVDTLSKPKCIEQWKNRSKIRESAFFKSNDFYTLYKDYCNATKFIDEPEILSLDKFKVNIEDKIDFQYDYKEYLKLRKNEYDLIIASNIFHYEKNTNEYEKNLSLVKSALKSDGIIYIRVENVKKEFDLSKFKDAVKKIFGTTTMLEFHVRGKWKWFVYINTGLTQLSKEYGLSMA